MEFRRPPKELVPFGLRAMKTVALADGEFDEVEREMLAGAQRFHGTSFDVDGLDPIRPAELAAAIVDPHLRRQIVHAMVICAAIDESPSAAELEVIQRFAAALDVEVAELAGLRKLIAGELISVRIDVLRRFWVRDKMKEEFRRGGFRWLGRSLAALARIKEDGPLAERYRALADYPEGTVGRSYHDAMRANGFPLPGEKGSFPEPIVIHDLTHVLSGYSTDPDGEVQAAAFHAGYRRKDPFAFVFFVLLQFHLGIRTTPAGPAHRGHFDVEKVLRAIERGAAMNLDLTEGWDPWTIMDRSLEEVRAEFGIPALAGG